MYLELDFNSTQIVINLLNEVTGFTVTMQWSCGGMRETVNVSPLQVQGETEMLQFKPDYHFTCLYSTMYLPVMLFQIVIFIDIQRDFVNNCILSFSIVILL